MSTIPSYGNATAAVGSVDLQVSLGRRAFGIPAGFLSIKQFDPTNTLATPGRLRFRYPTNSDCELVTNSAGIVLQVKAPECLANVYTNAGDFCRYWIDVYPSSSVTTNKDASGRYILSGAPLLSHTICNPDTTGNTTNLLRVTDGNGVVSDYVWKTNGWMLTNGGGLQKIYKPTVWSASNTVQTISTEIRDVAENLVSTKSRTYTSNSAGVLLTQETFGNGSVGATNSYTYITNASLTTTGLLQQAFYADGSWKYIRYDTNRLVTNAISVFLNQSATNDASLARSIEYGYGTNAVPGAGDKGHLIPNTPRRTIQYLLGHEISRKYYVLVGSKQREIESVTAGVAWDDASNLVTTTCWYTNGPNSNRVWTVERPDGTMTVYDYWIGTNRTNIVMIGTPDGTKTNISDGSKSVTVVGPYGQMISRSVIDIASGITSLSEVYSDYDDYNRPRKISYLDGTYSWTEFGCCGPQVETNKEGTATFYFDDQLKRRAASTKNNITTTNIFDANGNLLSTIRIGSDGTQITTVTNSYDTAGTRVSSKDALGNTTTYSEIITNAQRLCTTTNPDGSTKIELYYSDGQLAKITGTAVHPIRYDYGVEQDGGVWRAYTKEIKLDSSGNDTSEWTKTYRNMVGRSYKTVYSDGASRQTIYNVKGQRAREIDPDGVSTVFDYNARGELEYTGIDINRNGTNDFSGTDRIRRTVKSTTTDGSYSVTQTRNYLWATNNSAASNLISMAETKTDGLISWSVSYGLTNQTQTRYAGSGARYVTNTTPDGSYSVTYFQDGQMISTTWKDASGNQLIQTTYSYDYHGRKWTTTDARNGTTVYGYDNGDRMTSVTTPSPGNGKNAQINRYDYDYAGRRTRTVLPDGASVTNEYYPSGELKRNYGARVYPVAYGYDSQGRMKTMTNWSSFSGQTGARVTTWQYDTNRGFLTQKLYADTNGPSYTYTPAGRMRTRTWARGITTTYETNAAGETIGLTYSDGTTPNVTYNLDRQGRRTNIIDGASSRFLTYSDAGLLLLETNASGTMAGLSLRNSYDSLNRRTNVSSYSGTTVLSSASYSYGSGSRLTNVTDGTYNASYDYLANSALISQITYRSNSTTRMTTTKSYDYLNRLLSISSQPSADSAVSFNYAYNDANRRTGVEEADGSYWRYEYDPLGQVTSGKRYWADGTPVAGQQFEYTFDDIGNRTQTKEGGDATGRNLRSANYSANTLNQYTSRDVPAASEIIGAANALASVTVNGQPPYRYGEYYRSEVAINNTSSGVWQGITNQAVLSGTTNLTNGYLFLPKNQETFTYDLDGNQTSDGRWTNKWDAENCLISMESLAGAPSGSVRRLTFLYNSDGKRISKKTEASNSFWSVTLSNKYVYDGWNAVAEVNGTNKSVVASYLWGLDMSGSLAALGGAGSLLASTADGDSDFVGYDGNGNVVVSLNCSDGKTRVRDEYALFGEPIRINGARTTAQRFRFSTKYCDEETGWHYYGHRFLRSDGRWLSRDPVERGPLYVFVANAPVNQSDVLGLFTIDDTTIYLGKVNSGGLLGGVTSGETYPDLTQEVHAHIEDEGKTCCIGSVAAWLHIRMYIPVAGDVFAWDHLNRPLTTAQAHNVWAHEFLHEEAVRAIAAALGPNLENQCAGKCWKRDCLAARWTETTCQQFAEGKVQAGLNYIESQMRQSGDFLHDLIDDHDPSRNPTVVITDEIRNEYRTIYQNEITGWSRDDRFCR